MKHFVILLTVSAVCLFITGCETIPNVPLTTFAMHGHDTIVPTKPITVSYVKELPARKSFKEVPKEILNQYFDKIPEEVRTYNLLKQNLNTPGARETQDGITLNFIIAVVDYELKKIKYKPSRELIALGVKRSDMPLPMIKMVDQRKLFNSPRIADKERLKYNVMRRKYDYLVKIDILVNDLFIKCGLTENDRYWFKKFAVLKYEFIGLTWNWHQINEKMREAL